MRYALYFVPDPDTEIAALGARWLGRDVERDVTFAAPVIEGLDAATHARIVARPRRYGFHATLCAPFRLAEGHGQADLVAAFRDFARHAAPVRIPVLSVQQHRRFLALTPAVDDSRLDDLARAAVGSLETLRAPLSPAETARRAAEGLSDRQSRNLERWGYPYVGDDFRFHMTLTGALDDSERDHIATLVSAFFAPATGRGIAVNRAALLVEPEDGADFHILADAALGGPLAYTRRAVRGEPAPADAGTPVWRR